MDHLRSYSRLLQLPPSLLQFHSFLGVLEDMAKEDSPFGRVQPLLFSVRNTNHNVSNQKNITSVEVS